jgi:hypothetical protein
MTDNQTVDRLDLIIQALEKYIAFTPSFYDVGKEALDAARELKALKPVGYMDKKGLVFNDTTYPHFYTPLYTLDEVTK